ncbi:MAG TPA: rhodanese-like domain-containing protein [Oceanipulchritudo sp.]|nr:rhodanese-like domain-containing protein [Oceanipulchritudo sp.]
MNIWVIVGLAAMATALILLPRLGWISVREAQDLIKSGALLVDVRSPGEFGGGSVPGAVNMPLGDIREQVDSGQISKNDPVILFCASGTRSSMAKRQLRGAGLTNVHNLGSYSRARQLQSD